MTDHDRIRCVKEWTCPVSTDFFSQVLRIFVISAGLREATAPSSSRREESFFLTDSRYWTQAEEEVKEAKIVHYKKKTDGILSLFSELGLKRIGFESSALPFSLYQSLLEKLPEKTELIPLDTEIKNLRAVKDAQEIGSVREAIKIASDAF